MAAKLELEGVVRDYGGGVIIGPVDLHVDPGEFISLLGPSGCGKTTLLRMIAGFEPLSFGNVRIGDKTIGHEPAHRRGVGFVFQNYALFPHLTASQNVAFGLKLRRRSQMEIAERTKRALDVVGLSGVGDRLPSELSGGQQQRVAIARAIVLEPPLILFDEPLSNLDLKLRLQMRSELRRIQSELGTTCVYVTHDQHEALALSDRIVVMKGGMVEQIGTPGDIYNSPRTRFVADFVGTSNFIPLDAIEAAMGGAPLPRAGATKQDGWPATGAAQDREWFCLRPEAIRLAAAGTPAPEGQVALAGTIETVTYIGERFETTVRVNGIGPDSILVAYHPVAPAPSDQVTVCFDPDSCVLVGK